MEALAKWRQYLLDAAETFEIWMDYENLKYFWEPHKLNRQQARWYLKLQDYDFILRHIPGKTNTKADILLRKDQVDTKEDNKMCNSLSGMVHTGVEVRRMYSEMSRLVEQPWLQLMCCAVCLPHGRNFRWKREVWVGVSAEWCVAVEHWRSSSIRDYLFRLSD